MGRGLGGSVCLVVLIVCVCVYERVCVCVVDPDASPHLL